MKATYEITECHNPALVGTQFTVEDGDIRTMDHMKLISASIDHMESHGYSEWCMERDIGSWDFDYERVDD